MRERKPERKKQYRAKKRFGQNFLTDTAVLYSLVRHIHPQNKQAVVEIGPGFGALTEPLLQQIGFLWVIELDRELAKRWHKYSNITVLESDVLQVNFSALAAHFAPQKLRLVGNLPYNISSPLLFHLLPWATHIQDQHFMLQKEVAKRMVAAPDTAAYGRMSILLQWRYEMELLEVVSATAFRPQPKVESAFVRMVPRAQPITVQRQMLEEVVKVAFSQRRKILKNTLGYWLGQRGFGGDFDLSRRAQEITVAEFVKLAQMLEAIS